MAIGVDYTAHSAVIWCTDCPWWSEITTHRLAGLNEAARHEADVHTTTRIARNTRNKYQARHAGK
jgi:hypothetical protein